MSASVRGKKRQEVIERWLKGEEDPNYEVIPTRVDGKYIVRPREQQTSSDIRKTSPEIRKPSQVSVENTEAAKRFLAASECSKEEEDEYYEYEEEEIEKPKPVTKKPKSRTLKGENIQLEMLKQLRILGEESLRKRAKKERKKETRHIIRKELSRRHPIQYSDDDYEDEYEVEEPQVVVRPPIYARRRINLLSDYR